MQRLNELLDVHGEREREILFGKNKEYKKAKSFIWMF